jgi:integrase
MNYSLRYQKQGKNTYLRCNITHSFDKQTTNIPVSLGKVPERYLSKEIDTILKAVDPQLKFIKQKLSLIDKYVLDFNTLKRNQVISHDELKSDVRKLFGKNDGEKIRKQDGKAGFDFNTPLTNYIDDYIKNDTGFQPNSIAKRKTLKTHLLNMNIVFKKEFLFSDIVGSEFRNNYITYALGNYPKVGKEPFQHYTMHKTADFVFGYLQFVLRNFVEIDEKRRFSEVYDDFRKYLRDDLKKRYPKPKTKPVIMTVEEINQFRNDFTPQNQREQEIYDLMILQLFTGMRISDLMAFDYKNYNAEKGTYFFRMKKVNTHSLEIPLLPPAREVVEKYEEFGQLPKISEQKFNERIKEFAERAGLNREIRVEIAKKGRINDETIKLHEKLTSHSFRRSFASMFYNLKFPVPFIRKLTGHTTDSAFYQYIGEDFDTESKMNEEAINRAKNLFK